MGKASPTATPKENKISISPRIYFFSHPFLASYFMGMFIDKTSLFFCMLLIVTKEKYSVLNSFKKLSKQILIER